jgi:hypothetical protein
MRFNVTTLAILATIAVTSTAQAFCGFYVSRADTDLFNDASQVVLVRDGDRTVITMANDFEGDVADFAVVIPVPTRIEREQINVGERAVIEHLDAYTAPRLVEYHDPNPCGRFDVYREMNDESRASPGTVGATQRSAKARGVTIEASYTVGEYDILILSAKESNGLIQWLDENGYKVPDGAEKVVGSYIRQDMRFFVARVNLEEQAELGFRYLRPLQVAFESKRFMLPIRLGTLNAKGKQDLYVYALTRTGRVETTNYRTVRIPSDMEIPEFVQHEFGDFYRAMFANNVRRENERAVFLEYAWDMGWCDPCAADPLSTRELRDLGVFWIDDGRSGNADSMTPVNAMDVFVTRLHVRYDASHFPEDLMFQETGDRQNFQGRYVIRRPWRGDSSCDTSQYEAGVRQRQEHEAQQLASLTGWSVSDIREKIDFAGGVRPGIIDEPWWKRLWN